MSALKHEYVDDLSYCESVIERGLETFFEVGSALISIRDKKLYKKQSTFEAYCRERWGMARSTAYQLIDAVRVVENVRHGGQIAPETERQARPLVGLEPEEQVEIWTEAVRTAPNGKLTAAHVEATVKEQRTQKKLSELEAKAEAAPVEVQTEWTILQGDCEFWLDAENMHGKDWERLGYPDDFQPLILAGDVQLIFADPPYNIGIEYGDHYDDSKDDVVFLKWCKAWLNSCHNVLADNGSLWLLVNYKWAWMLCYEACKLGFNLHRWLTWYESFGQNSAHEFNYTSRPLLWLTKDKEDFIFNSDACEIRRESDRQAIYNDKRANPDGKIWDDVWGVKPPIPRLTGTCAERMPLFPTQLPLALLRPIVACASNPGELVVDPFSGSGTTGHACIELGRRFVGIELSEQFAELSRKRLRGVRT